MENTGKLIKTISRNIRSGLSVPDFFGFVRRLENGRKDLPRLGYAKHPRQECVRFGQVPFLHFPTSEIADVDIGSRGADAIIMTYFFGLLGVNGPMPLEFTSYVLQRSHNYYDHAWCRFMDIIHHRMLVFFYRAFAANEQSVSFDRPDDRVSEVIKSLSGFSPANLYGNMEESLILRYANRFGIICKTRAALEDMLCNLLKLKVEVKGFIRENYDIPENFRAVLGSRKTATLGVNLQIGGTYRSLTRKFELRIGPVDFATSQDYMPGTRRFTLLAKVIKLYLDRDFDYDIRFALIGDTVSGAYLGTSSARLGYTCFTGRVGSGEVPLVIGASRIAKQIVKLG